VFAGAHRSEWPHNKTPGSLAAGRFSYHRLTHAPSDPGITPHLPMAATPVATPASVEATTTTTMEAASAMKSPAAMVRRSSAASRIGPPACKPTAANEPASANISTAVAVAMTPTTPSAASPAIPRTGADKHAAYKPVRPVISIRRARIRIIVIVAVRAGWRSANVTIARAPSNSHSHLRLRIAQRQHQNRHQRQIFEVLHSSPLSQIPLNRPRTQRICRPFRS